MEFNWRTFPAFSRIPEPEFEIKIDDDYRLPVVKIPEIPKSLQDQGVVFYALLGFIYPPYSSKRVAAGYMVKKSVKAGNHDKKQPFVESTSGNMGIALAHCAKKYGLKVSAIVSDNLPRGKVLALQRQHVDVVKESKALAALGLKKSPGSVALGKLYAKKIGGVNLNQYGNPWNAEAWEVLVAPEIMKNLKGKISMLVASVGTTGTLTGLARHFKKRNPKIKVVATMPYPNQEIGGTRDEKRLKEITLPWKKVVDIIEPIDYRMAQFLSAKLNEMGIPGGPSSGAALGSAEHLLSLMTPRELDSIRNKDGSIGVILPFVDSNYPYE